MGASGFVYLAESKELANALAAYMGMKDYALYAVNVPVEEFLEGTIKEFSYHEETFKALTGESSADFYMVNHDIPADQVEFIDCFRFVGEN